jgi:alcohol dehydrogenase
VRILNSKFLIHNYVLPPLPVGFDFKLGTRVVFGDGAIKNLGALAGELRCRHALIVADPGIAAAGHVDEAAASLRAAGVAETRFHDFDANPDSRMVEAGRQIAQAAGVDSLVAIGGGSSLDCAKGINFVLAGSGTMRDYRGYGKARGVLRPSIGIPTTAGTGSEASYAIVRRRDAREDGLRRSRRRLQDRDSRPALTVHSRAR